MLQASLSIDLPSEPADPGGPLQRLVRRLSGRKQLAGTDELVMAGREALRRILWGAESAGFENVVHMVADGEPLYVDRQQRRHDLDAVLSRVESHELLAQGFEHLRIVLSRRIEAMHTVASINVRDHVKSGEHEFAARFSTRLIELRPQPEETPVDWNARVREFVRDPANIESRMQAAKEILERARRGFENNLRVSDSVAAGPEARVVVPGVRQVGRFRHLRFGQFVRSPTYRALPEERRTGAYDDPHVYHYFDPYHDLISWVVVDEILAGHWKRDDVKLVHSDGTVLATATNDAALQGLQFEVPRNAVSIGEGGIAVAESVPALSGLDPAEAGSPHAPGFGGDMGQG